ncbi:non-homologous end joining protein Ku [Devosia rhizoryzae]|uniref:Non-homologous end joining protein Ku n=1 Tax=Devosia rhizoryzae TaxID=2774137 RepID=A0ABX7C4D1_9HYPH|nr:Ku protein [Devosia rhizoryzae]QQR38094.1 Ku protein [Devosia rhizoryzae]
MPASRPIWKGQLRLSLVSIPVELFSAAKTGAKPSFNQIHEPTGKRVHYEKVVEGVGPVDADEIIKGFEYEKGEYVLLTDDEIDAVRLETRKTMELTQFVGACEIDPIYFDKSYFVVPTDELAEDAFRVIRDALRNSQKVGLGQLSMRGKEYLAAIKPSGTGLMLETLHYEDEIRKSDSFFSTISSKKAEPDLLEVATALIEKKTAPFDAGVFKDHYQNALHELIARKVKSKGKKITADKDDGPARPSGANVVDLMAALKESLEGGSSKKPTPSAKKPAAANDEAPPARRSTARKPAAKTAAAKTTAAKAPSKTAAKSTATTRKKAS